MKKALTIEIISAALVLLFLYAGLSKLAHYDTFVFQVSESPLKLLAKSSLWTAWLIPVTEIILAALLPFSRTRLFALYSSAILMLLFTLYVGFLLTSGLPLPCACGGIISGLQWKGHLLFNIFFLAISIAGIALERKTRKMNHTTYLHPYPVGYL